MIERPKDDSRYSWTSHSAYKMAEYRLSPSLIKRIIRFPERLEEGIADDTVAVMKPEAGTSKKKGEVWTMYKIEKAKEKNSKPKLKIITAWRYPGKSPEHNPIPEDILREIREALNN